MPLTPPPRPPSAGSGPVLFARAGALGDFVLTLPRLARLFASGRRVDVACARKHRPLVGLVGQPGRFYDIDGVEGLWLFGQGKPPVAYEEVICFSEAVALSPNTPAPRFTRFAARPPPGVSAASHFGGVPLSVPTPELRGGEVVIFPGAGAPEKRWPGWEEVASQLRDVLFIGGPLEPEMKFRPDLDELIEFARGARVWLGVDSGPSHLAAFLACPTGVVFTTTNPAIWAPPGAKVFTPPVTPAEVVAWVRTVA